MEQRIKTGCFLLPAYCQLCRDSGSLSAPPIFPHLACVANAAGAGVLAMMRRDVTLLYFEGSGEELNSRHPAKDELMS